MIELLNKRIKELRTEAGMTQSELATKLGIAKNTLCQYEKNKSNPSLEIIIQVSKIFEVSIEYLLGLEDDFGINTHSTTMPGLSTEEMQLIEDYRSLSPDLKEMIRKTLDIYTQRVTIKVNQ